MLLRWSGDRGRGNLFTGRRLESGKAQMVRSSNYTWNNLALSWLNKELTQSHSMGWDSTDPAESRIKKTSALGLLTVLAQIRLVLKSKFLTEKYHILCIYPYLENLGLICATSKCNFSNLFTMLCIMDLWKSLESDLWSEIMLSLKENHRKYKPRKL